MKTIVLILVAAASFHSLGSDTNEIFLPFDPRGYSSKAVEAAEREKQVLAARDRPESRPAELDSQGHWGDIVDGLQMSLRFSKTEYSAGQPISATVILRNTTTNILPIWSPTYASIGLVIMNERGEEVPTPHSAKTISGPMRLFLPGHRQLEYPLSIGEYAKLDAPGVYTIYAKRRVPEHLAGAASSLRSSSATIRILGPKEKGSATRLVPGDTPE